MVSFRFAQLYMHRIKTNYMSSPMSNGVDYTKNPMIISLKHTKLLIAGPKITLFINAGVKKLL